MMFVLNQMMLLLVIVDDIILDFLFQDVMKLDCAIN